MPFVPFMFIHFCVVGVDVGVGNCHTQLLLIIQNNDALIAYIHHRWNSIQLYDMDVSLGRWEMFVSVLVMEFELDCDIDQQSGEMPYFPYVRKRSIRLQSISTINSQFICNWEWIESRTDVAYQLRPFQCRSTNVWRLRWKSPMNGAWIEDFDSEMVTQLSLISRMWKQMELEYGNVETFETSENCRSCHRPANVTRM